MYAKAPFRYSTRSAAPTFPIRPVSAEYDANFNNLLNFVTLMISCVPNANYSTPNRSFFSISLLLRLSEFHIFSPAFYFQTCSIHGVFSRLGFETSKRN